MGQPPWAMVSPAAYEIHGTPAVARISRRTRRGPSPVPPIFTSILDPESTNMSNQVFVLALVTGAALLALWLELRLPGSCPQASGRSSFTVPWPSRGSGSFPAGRAGGGGANVTIFAIALPALVYVFLVAIWFMRHAQSVLRSASR